MALCGMDSIDLMEDVIKILGIYFSYNKKLEQEKNFLNHIVKIHNILKLRKLRNLTIEGRIIFFKSLAISKLIYLTLVTKIPTTTINLLTKIQMEFIWKWKNPKIKNSTLSNPYEYGGLKNVDIFSKVISLQCSWIKRLFNNSFHQWKLIPLYLFRKYLGKNFKFHSNLEVIQFYASFLNSIKRYSLDGANIFLHRLLCHQQLHVSLFGLRSIFKLIIKAFVFIISRIEI